MNEQKDGGPAFPQNDLSGYGMGPSETGNRGMSLRDWFAGQADVPWNAVIETMALRGNAKPTVLEMATYRAELKYIEAAAMLSARAHAMAMVGLKAEGV